MNNSTMNIHTQVCIQMCFISHGWVPRGGTVELYDKLETQKPLWCHRTNRVGHPKSSFSTEITKNYQIWQNKPCWTLGSNQILDSSWRVLGEREPLDFRGKHYSPCWQWHEDSSPCSWCSLLKLGETSFQYCAMHSEQRWWFPRGAVQHLVCQAYTPWL